MTNFLTTSTKRLGLPLLMAGLITFSACDNNAEHKEDAEEIVAEAEDQLETENASNMEYEAPERDYDVETMGTASANRTKTWEARKAEMNAEDAEASTNNAGTNSTNSSSDTNMKMSDTDYQAAYKEYSDVNQEIRDALRAHPEVDYRYTDDYKTSDYNMDYYGIYWNNVSDNNTSKQMQDMERRRQESRTKLKGQMNADKTAYVMADVDAVPNMGWDALYEFLEDEIEYPSNAQAAEIEGTIFVDFIVDANGNVVNPKIASSIQGQTQPDKGPRNPTQVSEQEREEAIKEMEKEALEAVKKTSGKWDAAMFNDKKVPMEATLPVRFQIRDI